MTGIAMANNFCHSKSCSSESRRTKPVNFLDCFSQNALALEIMFQLLMLLFRNIALVLIMYHIQQPGHPGSECGQLGR